MRTHLQMTEGPANPFIDDIFLNHPDVLPGAAAIHHSTFQSIVDSVEAFVSPSERISPADTIGRIVLITAPRAGFGKTHLAARIKKQLRSSATTLTLPFDPSRPVSWPVALNSILRQFLNEPARRSSDLCLFAESGHFLLSQVILSHRNAGSLKPGQCPVEEEALRSEFFSIFSPGSELMSWTDHQSRDLTRRAESNFLHVLGLSASELGFWVRLIIDFTLRGESALEPLRGLSNGEARERMQQWLRIATFYRPNLIIADGLDGFFQSETAGLEIAGILTGIRESVPRSITLICLNEDIWKSVFEDRLPSAWLDRLTGEKEKLRTITPEAAGDLVRNRLKRIPLSESQAARFIERLKTDHLWIDSEAKLYPRAVIRQARDLWASDSDQFLKQESDSGHEEIEEQEPLSSITDKVAFFEALAEDRPLPKTSVETSELKNGDELFPCETKPVEPPRLNPFFAPPPTERDSKLVGIDSIIEDIRGTGKTVVSEAAAPTPPPLPSQEERESFEAGLLRLKHGNRQDDSKSPDGFTPPHVRQKPMAPPPEKKPDWMAVLKSREEGLLENPSLRLDLEKVERFIRKIGVQHPGLSQSEERFPSSRTVCVRWNVRGESVLLGFESPQNVYFWNNLLQQSLASNRREKLAAFSHRTEAFDPGLFSSFGFSPAVARDRIDVIEMNDRELAMIYATDSIISESENTVEAPAAVQIAIRYLDPLWRRISKAI
ncbi:MAG: hypothetical protein P1U81_01815 [Verrucomicrobiales bacterium]|nr:hypothetical protein [Verrucomicrobiales bacterium]